MFFFCSFTGLALAVLDCFYVKAHTAQLQQAPVLLLWVQRPLPILSPPPSRPFCSVTSAAAHNFSGGTERLLGCLLSPQGAVCSTAVIFEAVLVPASCGSPSSRELCCHRYGRVAGSVLIVFLRADYGVLIGWCCGVPTLAALRLLINEDAFQAREAGEPPAKVPIPCAGPR